MSKVMVNESSLTAIGEAIRGKNGTTNTYKPSEMAAAISSIPAGGGNLDFSNLEYVQLTSKSNDSVLPDLTPFISDFNKVVCIMIQDSNQSFVYLRGTDTDRSPYKDMFHYIGNRGSYYYSTPSTKLNSKGCYALNITSLIKPEIIVMYSTTNKTTLSAPWQGGFIMYYEGG